MKKVFANYLFFFAKLESCFMDLIRQFMFKRGGIENDIL